MTCTRATTRSHHPCTALHPKACPAHAKSLRSRHPTVAPHPTDSPVRGDLIRILGKLLRRRNKFDYIMIETTGLANPAPVIQVGARRALAPAQTFGVPQSWLCEQCRAFAYVHPLALALHAHTRLPAPMSAHLVCMLTPC